MQYTLELFLKERKKKKKPKAVTAYIWFYPFYNTRQYNWFLISYYVMKMVTEKSS